MLKEETACTDGQACKNEVERVALNLPLNFEWGGGGRLLKFV